MSDNNKVIHFEIVGKDGAALQRYYSALFGWTVNTDNPGGYGMTDPRQTRVVVGIGDTFDGWIDAGGASSVAAARLADGGTAVATFDGDILFDYRARRPTLEIVDGQIADLTWPDLTLWHRRIDDRDLLVLTGAEPDFRWHDLAASAFELPGQLDISLGISLGALPGAVPHTRGVAALD